MTKNQLPETRRGYSHSFHVNKQKCHLILNTEIRNNKEEIIECFLEAGKFGTSLRGMTNALSFAINVHLRYGGNIHDFLDAFEKMEFLPNGKTNNKEIQEVPSILSYIAQYIKLCESNGGYLKHKAKDKVTIMENFTDEQMILEQEKALQSCNVKGGG